VLVGPRRDHLELVAVDGQGHEGTLPVAT
jgi:hypothetical protein